MVSHQQFSLTSHRICSIPKLRQTCADTNKGWDLFLAVRIIWAPRARGLGHSPTLWRPPLHPHLSHCLDIWPPETCLQVLQASKAPRMWGLWDQYNLAQTLNIAPSPRCVSGCHPLTPPSEGLVPLLSTKAGLSSEFLISFHLFSKCKLLIVLSISLGFTFSLFLYSSFSLPLPT